MAFYSNKTEEYLDNIYNIEARIFKLESILKKLKKLVRLSDYRPQKGTHGRQYEYINKSAPSDNADIELCIQMVKEYIPGNSLSDLNNAYTKEYSSIQAKYKSAFMAAGMPVEQHYEHEWLSKNIPNLITNTKLYCIFIAFGIFLCLPLGIIMLRSNIMLGVMFFIFSCLLIIAGIIGIKQDNIKAAKHKKRIIAFEAKRKKYRELKSKEQLHLKKLTEAWEPVFDVRINEENEMLQRIHTVVSANIIELNKSLDILVESRRKLYGKDIIFQKYHNLLAISTLLEYFKSSRCSELHGANGAYNLFETESHQGILFTKIEQAQKNLQKLEQTQYLAYMTIMQTNETLADIAAQIKAKISSDSFEHIIPFVAEISNTAKAISEKSNNFISSGI